MKLSFSTIGCPGWTFDEIVSVAKDAGFDGIEIRGIANELYAPHCSVFSKENINTSKERLQNLRIDIPIITTGAVLGDAAVSEKGMNEAKDCILLAQKLNSPYIRVMSVSVPEPAEMDFDLCVRNMRELCEFSADKNVTPLIETNGNLAKSEEMLRFISEVSVENIGILWDIHHPFRYFGEKPADTVYALGKYIKHVHIKDSVKENKVEYRMAGYGDVPIEDVVLNLKNIGYNGFLSLEWVKLWNPDLEEPGIVFLHYKSFMDSII